MNLLTIAADADPIKLDTTPLAGGFGREAKAHLGGNSAGVVLEGHDGMPDGSTPLEDDEGWYTVLEAPFDGTVVEIEDLPMWVRPGAGATGPIVLEGVQ